MDRGCGRSDPRFDRLSPAVRPASGMLTIRGRTGPVATVGHASDATVMAAVIGSTDKFDKPDIVASDRSRTRGWAKRAGTMGRIGHTINSRHGSCLGRLPGCLVLAATLKPATAGRRPEQAWAADLASCS